MLINKTRYHQLTQSICGKSDSIFLNFKSQAFNIKSQAFFYANVQIELILTLSLHDCVCLYEYHYPQNGTRREGLSIRLTVRQFCTKNTKSTVIKFYRRSVDQDSVPSAQSTQSAFPPNWTPIGKNEP